MLLESQIKLYLWLTFGLELCIMLNTFMKLIAMLVFLFVVSCANKPNATFVLEIPHTYEEEKRVHDKYPVEPVEIKPLD